jgi:2-polyprenyl-3-methyl-5-hydroxy-6-metoxy-1,4-benzoquinol methylase
MRIERIVITGDVFRTTDGDPNQLSNVRWLCGELARPLNELTGLWPHVGYRRNAPDDGHAVIAEWYALMGHVPSLATWAATYGETAPPATLIEAMRPDYDRALVIGFELSPLMRAVLDRICVPWVDIAVSPIRFLEDLALSLRFSWRVALAHPGLLSPADIEKAVARMRARQWTCAPAADLKSACVFLAQTRYDRTLIKDGAFFADSEAVERLQQSLDGRPLVLKPHPLAPDNPLLGALQQRLCARTTDANIYAILATAVDVRFLTISSSAAIEAGHFGHPAEIFHSAAHADLGPITSLWAHRSAAFWRSALRPMFGLRLVLTSILRRKPRVEFEERATPDRLRRIHGSWGMARHTPNKDLQSMQKSLPCGAKVPLVEDGANVVLYRGSEAHPAYRCSECGYIFFDPPDSAFLQEYYNDEYPRSAASWYNADGNYEPDRCSARVERITAIAERFLGTKDVSYHEAGCAFGGVIAMFRSKGYDASGTDINEAAINEGRLRGNRDIFPESEWTFFNRTGRQVDVLFSFHAVEHMPRPDEFLVEISSLLASRGIVIIFVPNSMAAQSMLKSFYSNPWFAYPDHLHLFSAKAALCLAERTGYELLDVWTEMLTDDPNKDAVVLGADPAVHEARVRAYLIKSSFLGQELCFVLTPKGSETASRLADQIAAVRAHCQAAGKREEAMLELCAEKRIGRGSSEGSQKNPMTSSYPSLATATAPVWAYLLGS